MSYMDGQDKRIQEQMRAEGKVRIINFDKMIENYIKNKYNIHGYFEFLYVEYEYFDKDHIIYNVDLGQYVARPENRKVKTMMPFFIEQNAITDPRRFLLKIPGIIDHSNLKSEVLNRLPNGVRLISNSEIKEALFNQGYVEPYFDHYFYSMMDYPSYNVYAKPITKTNFQNADQSYFEDETARKK